jgi:hypothetical protein
MPRKGAQIWRPCSIGRKMRAPARRAVFTPNEVGWRMVTPVFERRSVDELDISDEESFRHVGLYADLKEVVRRAGVSFRVLPAGSGARWGRAQLLNLTLWAGDAGGDVLVDAHVPADVIAHVAWHHLAGRAFAAAEGAPASVDALILGEAIASAFDVYLVGRLLGHAPRSSFLETQVPAMADTAAEAGLDEDAFEALLGDLARDPDAAFEDLRALLVDAATGLVACTSAADALVVLSGLEGRRLEPLLHRFELANWILHAQVHGTRAPDPRARAVDRALRTAPRALDWLDQTWVAPAISRV